MASSDCRYDRSVSESFLEHFLPGGFGASLVEYAGSRFPTDLQFRKNPMNGAEWASLYVGMTSVLDVMSHKAGLKLRTNKKYAHASRGWNAEWTTPRSPECWPEMWAAVEDYLEQIIPFVMLDGRFTRTEGLVQAAVTAFKGDSQRVVLDREVTPHFRDEVVKKAIQDRFSGPLSNAVAANTPFKGSPRTPFGMKCDALAVDSTGRLVAIEVKPGNVASLAWVAAQATMYARVLQYWVEVDPSWRSVIERMLDQRRRLGLASSEFSSPTLVPEVIPAVAFQRTANPVYRDRMFAVQEALLKEGVGDPRLRFYSASLSGRLDLLQS